MTYGEAPDYRRRILEEWDQHLAAAYADDDHQVEFVRSLASYAYARMTDGPRTLIPTGLCFLVGSISAFSIALSGVSPEIAVWRQSLLATVLLGNAIVLLRSPISPHRNTLAISLVFLAIAAPVPMSELNPVVPADYLLIAGWALVSLGALAFGLTSVRGMPQIQRIAVWILAAGFFGVGIANASWTNITTSIEAAASCALAGAIGLIGAWSALRLSELGSPQQTVQS